MTALIYKIARANEWKKAQETGFYTGSPDDEADGFIHFSTADQMVETAHKHFTGETGLILLEIDCHLLKVGTLKWEPSRGGALFPHLFDQLALSAVTGIADLPLDEKGAHTFPRTLPLKEADHA